MSEISCSVMMKRDGFFAHLSASEILYKIYFFPAQNTKLKSPRYFHTLLRVINIIHIPEMPVDLMESLIILWLP